MELEDIQGEVAVIAWKLWPLIFDGPQTLEELRARLDSPADGEVLSFALGWLAWEKKIEIRYEQNVFWALRRPVSSIEHRQGCGP